MDTLDSHIISVIESYTDKVEKDKFGLNIFSPESNAWERILSSLSLLEFPHIKVDPETSLLAIMRAGGPIQTTPGAYVTINEDFKGYKLENIYRLEFHSLYPAIIHKFILAGRVEQSISIRIFCRLWLQRSYYKGLLSSKGYEVLRLWINYFYGKIPKVAPELEQLEIVGEAKICLQSAQDAADEWYYVDSDDLYFVTEDLEAFKAHVSKSKLDFEITEIRKAVFFANRRYIIGDQNTVMVGFKRPKNKK